MQNSKGNDAKAMTNAEHNIFCDQVKRKVELYCTANPGWVANWFLYSTDNASYHSACLPIFGGRKLKLAAHSPDLHRVVEHCHGSIKGKFYKMLRDDPNITTAQDALVLLYVAANECCTPEVIKKDVENLPATYEAVIEAKGDYPVKRFR